MPYKDKEKAKVARKKWKQSPEGKAAGKKYQKKCHDIMYELKNGKKCANCGCGFDDCLSILEFHHIDTKTKLFLISGGGILSKSFKQIQEEVNKCILLCRNCHTELHHPEYNNE